MRTGVIGWIVAAIAVVLLVVLERWGRATAPAPSPVDAEDEDGHGRRAR